MAIKQAISKNILYLITISFYAKTHSLALPVEQQFLAMPIDL